MRVLVTGAAGFIGFCLTRRLLARGDEVIGIDNLNDYYQVSLKHDRVKLLREEGIIAPSDRVVCILTGHQLKDPTATVAYHTTDQDKFNEVLGSRGDSRAS